MENVCFQFCDNKFFVLDQCCPRGGVFEERDVPPRNLTKLSTSKPRKYFYRGSGRSDNLVLAWENTVYDGLLVVVIGSIPRHSCCMNWGGEGVCDSIY